MNMNFVEAILHTLALSPGSLSVIGRGGAYSLASRLPPPPISLWKRASHTLLVSVSLGTRLTQPIILLFYLHSQV